MKPNTNTEAEKLAQLFHQTYETLAPSFTYHTRKASAVPWEDVPANNKGLMIAVAQHVIDQYVHQKTIEARIDELSHISADEEEIIVCYFTQENPDCSKDLPIEDRIAERQASLNTEGEK